MDEGSNSHLCRYLQHHFPPKEDEDAETAEMAITAHFWQELKVNTRRSDNYFTFKYDQTMCEKWDEVVLECRGIILRREKTMWKVVSRPFTKFFNQFEGQSPVNRDARFNELCKELKFVEKADGTCVQLWHDDSIDSSAIAKQWRISTLGAIVPADWVSELFWNLFATSLIEKLTPGLTYLFEMCCEQNRIVTLYPTDRLYIVAVRNIRTGEYFTLKEVDEVAESLNLIPLKIFNFVDEGVTTLREAKAWVEAQSLRDGYGKYPEGFVVYHNERPLCKFKNTTYLQKHGLATGDLLYVRKIVIDRFFEDTLDDSMDILQPPILAFVSELREKVKKTEKEIEDIRMNILPLVKGMTDRRSYVELIKKEVDNQWQGFFFQYQDDVIVEGKEIGGLIVQWLRRNYTRFRELWKETQVQEILDKEKAVNG